MATHSSVLAWRIPGMEEPGGLPSMGSHRVGHDWSNLAAAAANTNRLRKVNITYTPFAPFKDSWITFWFSNAEEPQAITSFLVLSKASWAYLSWRHSTDTSSLPCTFSEDQIKWSFLLGKASIIQNVYWSPEGKPKGACRAVMSSWKMNKEPWIEVLFQLFLSSTPLTELFALSVPQFLHR